MSRKYIVSFWLSLFLAFQSPLASANCTSGNCLMNLDSKTMIGAFAASIFTLAAGGFGSWWLDQILTAGYTFRCTIHASPLCCANSPVGVQLSNYNCTNQPNSADITCPANWRPYCLTYPEPTEALHDREVEIGRAAPIWIGISFTLVPAVFLWVATGIWLKQDLDRRTVNLES